MDQTYTARTVLVKNIKVVVFKSMYSFNKYSQENLSFLIDDSFDEVS